VYQLFDDILADFCIDKAQIEVNNTAGRSRSQVVSPFARGTLAPLSLVESTEGDRGRRGLAPDFKVLRRRAKMSAKVDIANIPADQGRSLFTNTGCRSSGTVVQSHTLAVPFNERRPVLTSDRGELEKVPVEADTQEHPYSKRRYSLSAVERNANKQRRYSDKLPGGAVSFCNRRRGGRMGRYYTTDRLRERIVLPTRFLLGGNITDPLNLNSLCDDEVNKSMNETTPISSPVPIPVHRLEVKVLVPANSADPLNLNAEDTDNCMAMKVSSLPGPVFRKRRKRNRRKKRNVHLQSHDKLNLETSVRTEVNSMEEMQLDKSGHTAGIDSSSRHKRVIDHIVSPVIPQRDPKWKRRRTASESRTDTASEEKLGETLDGIEVEKTFMRHKRRHLSMHIAGPHVPLHFRANHRKFLHGNYSGKGTVLGEYEDRRLAYFSREMFAGKDVLDVGCGIGHVTLSIARDFGARRVVGLDIDRKVIDTALKNKQHFASAVMPDASHFPIAIRHRLGPLAVPQLLPSTDAFSRATFVMVCYALVSLM